MSAILQCASIVEENLRARKAEFLRLGSEGMLATPELMQEIDEDIKALESE